MGSTSSKSQERVQCRQETKNRYVDNIIQNNRAKQARMQQIRTEMQQIRTEMQQIDPEMQQINSRMQIQQDQIKKMPVQNQLQQPQQPSQNNTLVDELLNKEPIDLFDIAEKQLKRGGSALTKHDLISIIIALELKYNNKIDKLNALNVKDLNLIIRTIIYDSDRYQHINTGVDGTNLVLPIANLASSTEPSAPPIALPSATLEVPPPRIKKFDICMIFCL